jgi:hypothetical protein
MSQPDPRKALAELVQNSLDAGAPRIRVTRMREKGVACLRVIDDGEGVIPEMDRSDALRYIATHIGHSRKRSLSPEERLTLMTQGQYGIGLLGFWSLGQVLEMRTCVPGQRSHRLVLHRDRPDFLIEPLRGRLALDERWTEVVVVGLHRAAQAALLGRRAADYLASELRGQLLARNVELTVEDRMSRGRGQKLFPVRPPRFLGERLEGIGPVEVPGHPPIRFEIYLAGDDGDGAESHGLAVYAAGTLVAEGFHALGALGLDRPPWTDPRLSGMVDFPGFQVAPGSRRGVVVDEGAHAFARALAAVEPFLSGLLESLERRRAEDLDRTLIRDLQRAFRDFYRQRPRYAMLPVQGERDQGAGPGGDGARDGSGDAGTGRDGFDSSEEPPALDTQAEQDLPVVEVSPIGTAYLLPPGPLATVSIVPSPVRVECGKTRRVRARAHDADGRPIEDPVAYDWNLTGAVGVLNQVEDVNASDHMLIHAAAEPAEGTLAVVARSGGREARDEAVVEVLDELLSRARSNEGIPEPEFVLQPGAPWRSRMLEDGRWQVNSGHRDYRTIADQPALKLRYLAMLFAKEVVLRSYQDLRLEKPLEQVVEVASYADLNLAAKRRRPRRRSTRDASDS